VHQETSIYPIRGPCVPAGYRVSQTQQQFNPWVPGDVDWRGPAWLALIRTTSCPRVYN
jgi:hypothetical protein